MMPIQNIGTRLNFRVFFFFWLKLNFSYFKNTIFLLPNFWEKNFFFFFSPTTIYTLWVDFSYKTYLSKLAIHFDHWPRDCISFSNQFQAMWVRAKLDGHITFELIVYCILAPKKKCICWVLTVKKCREFNDNCFNYKRKILFALCRMCVTVYL